MKRYYKKKFRSYKRKRFKRSVKKFRPFMSTYARKRYKRQRLLKRFSRPLKNRKGHRIKRYSYFSGSELLSNVVQINKNWLCLVYDIGSAAVKLRDDMFKSVRNNFVLSPIQWCYVQLLRQTRQTPLYYAMISDSLTIDSIKVDMRNMTISEFVQKNGIRIRPYAKSAIQGVSNDAAFDAPNLKLYILTANVSSPSTYINPTSEPLPMDIKVKSSFFHEYPAEETYTFKDQQGQERQATRGIKKLEEQELVAEVAPDWFDLKVKIGCKMQYSANTINPLTLDPKTFKDILLKKNVDPKVAEEQSQRLTTYLRRDRPRSQSKLGNQIYDFFNRITNSSAWNQFQNSLINNAVTAITTSAVNNSNQLAIV